MIELFQGFGLSPWSMCNVVFPSLKERFPSCVGDFNTLLCHSYMSYREQGQMCITVLFVVIEHVCDKYRWGDSVGVPGWRNASVFWACVTVGCFHVGSRFGRVTLLYTVGRLGCCCSAPSMYLCLLLVSLNELIQGRAIWPLWLRPHCLNPF